VSTGAKIAIGCLVTVMVVGLIATVGIVGFGYWAKGKVEQAAGSMTKTASEFEKYERQANTNVFTRPPDGAFTEDRLLKFLQVRQQVYAVYQLHKNDFETGKKQADLGDIVKFGGLVAEVKLAQAKAQAAVGMSDAEYLFMVQSVYGAAMNSAMQKEGGKTGGEIMGAAMDQYKDAMKAAGEAAQKAGATDKAHEGDLEEAEQKVDQAKETMTQVYGAPQSNIDLYRKHEADIRKYTMEGLALIGL
jgi:Tfp pilus assembly protein PilE